MPLCTINVGTEEQVDLWLQFGMAAVMKVQLNRLLSGLL